MTTPRTRLAVLPLALFTALTGCTMGGDEDPDATPSASAQPSVRPTVAAPVPNGLVSAKIKLSPDVKVDEVIARLNKLPGVLGAGYFASEDRIVVRLKPDATSAQLTAAIAAIRKEQVLTDISFEPPEPSPKPSPSATSTPKPSSTASAI